MHKRVIAVLAKEKSAIKFLEGFSGREELYKFHFYKTPHAFIRNLDKTSPAVLIIEQTFLSKVVGKNTELPILAIITGAAKKGIETAIHYQVDGYIVKPYMDVDLEYKLKTIILKNYAIEKMLSEIRELEVVVELTNMISSTLDPNEVLFSIVQKIAEVMPVSRCSIIRVDWIHRYAYVIATVEDPQAKGLKLNLKKYPEIIAALKSKKPVLIEDTDKDPRMQEVRDLIIPLGIRSILVVPILLRDKVIGTLFLRTSRTDHVFSDNEVKLLNAIGTASANALYNAFLFEQIEDEKTRLEKLSITDYLTGVYNVRYFYHRSIEEFSRSERYNLPASCLMLDIDHFKKINDTCGHKVGDKVLKEFAQVLKKGIRKSDVLARYGGEEFILLLPQTPPDGAFKEAERLRNMISRHNFRYLKGRKKITVSIGLASYPHDNVKEHEDLITFADDALFKAKNSGRNKVVIYDR
ncbi:MAG: diguanylate cyclase [Nitrospiraceae bacterium]|nr:MAG: diguanylate cyclase [Nitrospiraceae bacterium]